jgi:hypothetical protein
MDSYKARFKQFLYLGSNVGIPQVAEIKKKGNKCFDNNKTGIARVITLPLKFHRCAHTTLHVNCAMLWQRVIQCLMFPHIRPYSYSLWGIKILRRKETLQYPPNKAHDKKNFRLIIQLNWILSIFLWGTVV